MPYGMPYLATGELTDQTGDVLMAPGTANHASLDPNQQLLNAHHQYPSTAELSSLPVSSSAASLSQSSQNVINAGASSNSATHHMSGPASSVNGGQSVGVPSTVVTPVPSVSSDNADDATFYQLQMQNTPYQCDPGVRKRKRDLITPSEALSDWSSYTTDPNGAVVYEPEGRAMYTNVGVSMGENPPPAKQPYNSSYASYLDQSHAPWVTTTPNGASSQPTPNSSGNYHPNFAGDQLQSPSVSVTNSVTAVSGAHPQTTVGYQTLTSDSQLYDQQGNHAVLSGLPPMSSFRPGQPLPPNCGYPPSDNPTPPVSSPGWNRSVSGQTQVSLPVQSTANMTNNAYPPSDSTHLHNLVRKSLKVTQLHKVVS
jgi:hypothetical protein